MIACTDEDWANFCSGFGQLRSLNRNGSKALIFGRYSTLSFGTPALFYRTGLISFFGEGLLARFRLFGDLLFPRGVAPPFFEMTSR